MTTNIHELAADYEELYEFRNSIGNEDVLNDTASVALRLSRRIVEYPVTTIEELKSKADHIARYVARLDLREQLPEGTCLEDLSYWVLAHDVRALAKQQSQKEAA